MKRRDFMKMLGAVAIMPVALLRAKPKIHPVDVLIDLGLPNGKLTAEMREWCDADENGEPVYKAGPYDLPNGCKLRLFGITDMKEAQRIVDFMLAQNHAT